MSSQVELEEFEAQLETVNKGLASDPSNADLLTLKDELTNLITLTKDYLAQQNQSTSAASSSKAGGQSKSGTPTSSSWHSTPAPKEALAAGTEVLAKWHKDNRFYPARIAGVSGSASDPVYTVIFDVDKSTEVVRKDSIRALSESKKRVFQAQVEDDKDSKKKAKVEKKAVKEEERKARVADQNKKQTSWQSFAKKGAKTGKVHIPGMTGESMFKSPDNPYGRVGVVGSGKGMTSYEQKKRFKASADDAATED